MMTHERRKELWEARLRIEEVRFFLEENLHNVTLQEETVKLEMVVHRGEDYIARGVQIHSHLQWIQDGDESSKLFFNLLKRKVVVERVLSLRKEDESLAKDPSTVRGMFGLHLKKIFSPYTLTNYVGCYKC